MRVGQNPAKNITKIPKPKQITVAVLCYVPFLSGYFQQSLEVLKLCLESIWKNTDLPYDLLVFDNGSCPETREYLLKSQKQKQIQYLIFSEKNIGKGGAWNLIFSGAPGEIIAYCDSDALFYPGWLSACVSVLEVFPNTGMVTARPMRTREELFTSTLKWAEKTHSVRMEKGQIMTYPEFRDFADTMGYPEEKIHQIYKTTLDYRLRYKGLTAFAGANHFQFVGWKKVLNQFVPFNMDKPLGQVQLLDSQMNEAGYLRLSTEKSMVQNMSNHVPRNKATFNTGVGGGFSIKNIPLVKKVLLKLHDLIFRIYFEK